MDSVGIFESTPGNTSSARVMFVIGLTWAIVMTTVGLIWLHWGCGEAVAFFSATSGVFVTLKLGQKVIERPSPNNELKSTE